MPEFDPVAHQRRHRWLAKTTIQRELKKRGWTRFNGGQDWDAFSLPHGHDRYSPYGIHLTMRWREHIHQLELTARNRQLSWIHFPSYGVQLKRLTDFDRLMLEVTRLRFLVNLDIDKALAQETL